MKQTEEVYDIWLIDSISENMVKIDEGLTQSDAIDWWREWQGDCCDAVCVLAPRSIQMPKTITIRH